MIIRKAKESDIPSVFQIAKQQFAETSWNELQLKNELKRDGGKFIVACEDEQIIGFVCGIICENEIEIFDVAVSEIYKRKGVATKLLEELFSNENPSKIFLEVKAGNLPAINLYKKLGFNEISVRKKYYNGIDAIVMEKLC